ncbi:MAG: SDR family oxidoreductase [Rhodospirillum sp.]|nr:SDR family oxidoreductase [Rhodospirillum sp.]MCF8489483.1 SDR family oxidoreductase [Rhodospirillum sp.]
MDLELNGGTALVTGASRGIGAGVARRLAREGMDVALVGRDTGALADVAREIGEMGRRAVPLIHDLRDPDGAGRAVDGAVEALGGLDLLVNNAGATKRGDFFELTDGDWADGFALKMHGYVRMTRAAWPHLAARSGCLINIVGIGGYAGLGEFTVGGAVNAALHNFTKAMVDYGRRDGVRVNAVNPGRVQTERLDRNLDRIAGPRGIEREEAARELLAECGIDRFGDPDEIACAVAFLASSRAGFAQGSLFCVDGGEHRAI